MDIIELIIEWGPWAWIVGGAILLAIELIAPGGVFIWMGVSAIVVGLASLVQDIPWQWQFAAFAVLSLVTVVGWTRYIRNRPRESDRPFLNKRAERFIGEVHTLEEPIVNGAGRLKAGDGTWQIRGPDRAAGSKVKIVGAESSVLLVEPESAPRA